MPAHAKSFRRCQHSAQLVPAPDADNDPRLSHKFLRHGLFAPLYPFVATSHEVGRFFRVSVAGLLFDAVAFCDATLVISLGLRILAALLHWPIGERGVLRTKAQVG